MFKKILRAKRVALEWDQAFGTMDGKAMAIHGLPRFAGGATKAPYDILGDTLRGTRGLMLDKFRRPERMWRALAGSSSAQASSSTRPRPNA